MRALLRPLISASAGMLLACPAFASDVELFTPTTLSLGADVRLVGANGEQSWTSGGFGKARSSGASDSGFRVKPELGSVDLVWQPRAGFAWSATFVGTVQGGERTEAGLSEAFVSYKPMRGAGVRFSARAGMMWPPISTEHAGADWHVADTITPSSINSWVAEEVRPVAVEGTIASKAGGGEMSGTAALFAANDTAGTLLAFRGWALHDRRTLAPNRQTLPPLSEAFEYVQPRYSHPLLDVGPGFAERPGYYAKLAWQSPDNVRVELFRYDNRADPEAVNGDLEWGWRTRFTQAAIVAQPAPGLEVKAQALIGGTLMGPREAGRRWAHSPFKAAFLLATARAGEGKLAGRLDVFRVSAHGSYQDEESGERGWAALLAYSRPLARRLVAVAELLHVDSRRDEREEAGIRPRQAQTQLQAAVRLHW